MELYSLFALYDKDPNQAKQQAKQLSYLPHLMWLLRDEVQWLVPPGLPSETILQEDPKKCKTSLMREFKRLRTFFIDLSTNKLDLYPQIKKFKRESLYLEIINNIPKCEVEFLEEIRNKKLEKFSWLNNL